jgi:hypothetical protein
VRQTPTRKTVKGDRTVSMTVTVPLSVASAIDEEAAVMGRGFSDATATLLRIGISVRRHDRLPPEAEKETKT